MKYATNSLEYYWMPFTANREFKAHPRIFVRGEGVHYWNHEGQQVLDGSSGLFCCAAGHGRREIADAVANQIMELDYSPPFQGAHPAQFELARRVAALTPEGIDKVFFTNSGSESVDTAIKISPGLPPRPRRGSAHAHGVAGAGLPRRQHRWHQSQRSGEESRGLRRRHGRRRSHAPHMAWPRIVLPRVSPSTAPSSPTISSASPRCMVPDTVAAVFIEPIAGSTGTLVPPVGYLERVREICDKHGILLVFDEVITGFGRTGKAFAAQSFNVKPDIMTMAKALTNGNQPMGAVAVDDTIYDTICDASAGPGSSSSMVTPTRVIRPPAPRASPPWTSTSAKDFSTEPRSCRPTSWTQMFSLSDVSSITDVRGYGLLAGFDLSAAGDQPPG